MTYSEILCIWNSSLSSHPNIFVIVKEEICVLFQIISSFVNYEFCKHPHVINVKYTSYWTRPTVSRWLVINTKNVYHLKADILA